MTRIWSRSLRWLGHGVLSTAVLIVACSSGGGGEDKETEGGATRGLESCATACETFAVIGCSTRAAQFCRTARQSCQARYDASPACHAQLAAMDACSAAQPAGNFTCPMGRSPDSIRPYRVSQDVCVREAQALMDCLAR